MKQFEKLKMENKDNLEQQSNLIKKVRFKIENLTNNNNENDLREALNLLKISKKYGNYEVWKDSLDTVSYTHLRAHKTVLDHVCRLLLENKTDV
mgnify:CR=1 FL=1